MARPVYESHTVVIGDDTSERCRNIELPMQQSRRIRVMHLYIPSGQSEQRDDMNNFDAMKVWGLVEKGLAEFFELTPLATCRTEDAAISSDGWSNVISAQGNLFPTGPQKPWHMRFLLVEKPGAELPENLEIQLADGNAVSITTEELFSRNGVEFKVTIRKK